MATLTFRQPAPAESRFAPGSFDSWVGSRVPFLVAGRWVDGWLIVSANLSEDGTVVTLTVDVPTELVPQAPIPGRSLRMLD